MSKKRTPCPHCGELILPEARKCRFCGEKINSKSATLPLALYWSWFFSMVLFLVALFFVRRAPITSAGFWLTVLGLITLFGSVTFLLLLIKTIRSLKNKRVRLLGLASVLTFFAFFALLFNFETVEAKLGFAPPKIEQPTFSSPSIASPKPTSIPVQKNAAPARTNTTNSVTCTGPDGKTFQTTQEECTTFNKAWGNVPPPDQNGIIRCNIHPNCGGGYKEMTRSSCEQMTCCTVDFNNTMKFTSKDQCNREQDQSTAKSWNEHCNTMCSAYDSGFCANYWEVGSSGRANCISDTNRQKTECLSTCSNQQ